MGRKLNGTSDKVQSTTGDFYSASAGTIMVWVKLADTISDNNALFAVNEQGSTAQVSKELKIGFDDVVGSGGGSGRTNVMYLDIVTDTDQIYVTTQDAVVDTDYHCIVWTQDGGTVTKCYVDGVKLTLTVRLGSPSGMWFDTVTVDAHALGVLDRNTPLFYDGTWGTVAVWKNDITIKHALALTQGVSPIALGYDTDFGIYNELYGNFSPEEGYANGITITPTGTTKATHSPTEPMENYF